MIEQGRLLVETGDADEALGCSRRRSALANDSVTSSLTNSRREGVAGMVTDPYGPWIIDGGILKTGVYQDPS